jgi:hypothetical protein
MQIEQKKNSMMEIKDYAGGLYEAIKNGDVTPADARNLIGALSQQIKATLTQVQLVHIAQRMGVDKFEAYFGSEMLPDLKVSLKKIKKAA